MDVRQLRYFVALADELNFTRAAARCNVSQPPLSRAIRQLEGELGATLFERDTHHVRLTAAGASLAGDARRILELLEETGDRVRKVAIGLRGTLTVGFGGSTVYSFWPRLIRAFKTQAPDVDIVFKAMPVLEQLEALRGGTIDAGLIRLPVLDELVETIPVYEEPLAVALPSQHPLLETSGAIEISALADSRFVTYEARRGFNFQSDLHALCRFAKFEPRVVHEAPSTEAVVGIVSCGEGVAIVPASAERLRMRGVAFRPLDGTGMPPQLTSVAFGLAWRRGASSAVVAEFVASARDVAQSKSRPSG
ncbi:LysR family transcriptional regulator [Novosphingobium sp. RL4]|uniref:LysR family transcriptional regulator n=1 Tax=Novosphingobium sp. RL4 TaxID=3109595 RepID=UPI002D781ECB|nr:LysR family transcriptional regulator [Novosphingobium sp. RL4]WRT94450.1 LysR family transcriptional regulator [Novosphingobium sp. RL4]